MNVWNKFLHELVFFIKKGFILTIKKKKKVKFWILIDKLYEFQLNQTILTLRKSRLRQDFN